jgi:hypothetical protein
VEATGLAPAAWPGWCSACGRGCGFYHRFQGTFSGAVRFVLADDEQVKVLGESLNDSQLLQACTALEDNLARMGQRNRVKGRAHPVVLLNSEREDAELLRGDQNGSRELVSLGVPPQAVLCARRCHTAIRNTRVAAVVVRPSGSGTCSARSVRPEARSNPVTVATGTPGRGIPIHDPVALTVAPDGHTLYVLATPQGTEGNGPAVRGWITPVNLATRTTRHPVLVGYDPTAIAITPDGKTLYVTNEDSNTISVIPTRR